VCSSQTLIKRERDVGVTRLMQEVAQGVMRGTGQPKPVMPHPEGWFRARPGKPISEPPWPLPPPRGRGGGVTWCDVIVTVIAPRALHAQTHYTSANVNTSTR